MQKAIVAIEDSRFYQHGAVDLKGILRALNKNAQSGGVAQGASTLTQQYVKNVFVEEAGDDPTKVAAGHPADPRPQDQGAEVRDPGRGGARQEEDPRELPEHHLLRPAGLRRRGRRPALLLQARQGPERSRSRRCSPASCSRRAATTRSTTRRRPPSGATSCCSAWPTWATSRRRRPTRPRRQPLGLKVSKPKNGCITAVKGAGLLLRLRARGLPHRPGLRQDRRRPGPSSGTRAA